jgi:hypothetical protein
MGKNHFTEEQQIELLKSPYIQKVSEKSITYKKNSKKSLRKNIVLENLPHKFWLIWGLTIELSERGEKIAL